MSLYDNDNSLEEFNLNEQTNVFVVIELVVDFIFFFFGLVGNILVIYVQKKSKRQTRARYFLQLNAAGSIMYGQNY